MRMRSAIIYCTFLYRDRSVQFDGSSFFLRALYGELSTNLICAFAHSLEAKMPFARKGIVRGRKSAAIVRDYQRQAIRMVAKIDRCLSCVCVTYYIRQRLLGNAEDFIFKRWGERSIGTTDV